MDKEIRVSVRNVYGVEMIYPACKTSAFFCALACTKTLTHTMLCLIEAQGYAIVSEAPKLVRQGAHR